MKLKRLEIENIASFKKAVIDFDASHLKDADLFLINGETGSGKSTILDAICLALYADTPRLHNAEDQADKSDMPEGIAYNDLRRLLRQNTGKGSVKLSFEAEGKNWEAEWSVHRAYDRPDGSLQKKSWILKDVTDNKIFTKDAEIKQTSFQLIGLDFTQFCRTTMLSQGEFAAFLKSKPEQKADILKKITGVDRFERIGKMIYTITSSKKEILDKIDTEKKNLETEAMTPERRRGLEEEQAVHERNKALAEADKTRLQGAQKWVDDEAGVSKRLVQAQENLRKAEEALKDEAVVKASETVSVYDRTGDVRSLIAALGKSRRDEQSARAELNDRQVTFSRLSGALTSLHDNANAIETKLDGIRREIDAKASMKDIFEASSVIVGECANLAKWQSETADKTEQLDARATEIRETILPQITSISTKLQKLTDRQNELNGQLKVKETELEACDIAGKRKLKDSILAGQQHLAALGNAISRLQQCDGEIGRHRENIKVTDALIAQTSALLVDDDKAVIAAKSARDTQQDACDSAQLAAGKSAQQIRASLKIGDSCPVCGQKILHELQSDRLLRDLAEQAKAKLSLLSKAYDDALKLQTEHSNTLVLKKSDAEKYQKELVEKSADRTSLEKALTEACGVVGIEWIPDTTLDALNDLRILRAGELTVRLSAVEKEISDGEAIEKEIRKLRKSVAENQSDLDSANNEKTSEEKKKSNAENAVAALKAAIATTRTNIDAAVSKIAGLTGDRQVSSRDFRSEPSLFAGDLEKGAAAYNSLLEQAAALNRELTDLKAVIDGCDDMRQSILGDSPQWDDSGVSVPAKADAAKTRDGFSELKSAVIAAMARISKAREDAEVQSDGIERFFGGHPELDRVQVEAVAAIPDKDITEMRSKVQSAVNLADKCKENLKDVGKEHDDILLLRPEWLVADGAEPDAGAEDADSGDTSGKPSRVRVSELSGRIGEADGVITESIKQLALIKKEFDEAGKKDQQLAEVIKRHDEAEKDHNRWSQLNSLLGDSLGKRFSNIALSHLLGNLIHDANTYMAQLNDRYELDVLPGTFSIMVCDRYQGYSQRTANTISGGETFLVSLALALALSNIGQLSGCDTLFIDEGFGSLSGGPLDKAINTLKNLHRQDGRRIGIISHISELREKIPTQLIVERHGGSSASLRLLP